MKINNDLLRKAKSLLKISILFNLFLLINPSITKASDFMSDINQIKKEMLKTKLEEKFAPKGLFASNKDASKLDSSNMFAYQGRSNQGGRRGGRRGERRYGGRYGGRRQGGFNNRRRGGRRQGGFNNRRRGGRRQGGFNNRRRGGRRQGGFNNRRRGGRRQGHNFRRVVGGRPRPNFRRRHRSRGENIQLVCNCRRKEIGGPRPRRKPIPRLNNRRRNQRRNQGPW